MPRGHLGLSHTVYLSYASADAAFGRKVLQQVLEEAH